MKKVLVLISTEFVSYGGLTTVMMNYYRAMDKNNLIIDFASTNIARFELVNELKTNGGNYYCLGNRKNILQYTNNLKELLKSNKYDIVHVNANSTTSIMELSIAKRFNVKSRIVHIHNSVCNSRILHNLLHKSFTRSYTTAIACSNAAGEWIFGKNNFIILNNAVDTKKYSYDSAAREEIRKKHNIGNTFVLGHVGKINEQKNHDFLIEIFSEFVKLNKESKLLIVGDGPLRESIKIKAERYNLLDKVIFSGMCSDVDKYLSAMDCLVFPSKWEGLPLSLIEAQSSGLKCITSLNVTQEANLSNKVKYLDLSVPAGKWAKEIQKFGEYDRDEECNQNVNLIKKTGYDVYTNSSKLRELYING